MGKARLLSLSNPLHQEAGDITIALSGGNPFGSQNISSYWLTTSYKSDFNFESQPWKASFSTLSLGDPDLGAERTD